MPGSGYAATSVADVCAEAGLPVGSLYHLRAAFGDISELLWSAIDRHIGSAGTLDDRT